MPCRIYPAFLMPSTVSNMTFLSEFCILTQLKVVYLFIFTTCRIIVLCDVTDTITHKIWPRLIIACFWRTIHVVKANALRIRIVRSLRLHTPRINERHLYVVDFFFLPHKFQYHILKHTGFTKRPLKIMKYFFLQLINNTNTFLEQYCKQVAQYV